MSQKKFLYGASVQGIQGFIFQTNKLRDISGASELVEEICTTAFARILFGPELTANATDKALKDMLQEDSRVLLNAAGNIKIQPEDRKQCEEIVRIFPKMVQEKAPGITVSQAVVEYDEAVVSFADAIVQLEGRLRTQRNKPFRSNTLGWMGVRRSRNTGLPAVNFLKDDFIDEATIAKLFCDKQATKKREIINLCIKAFGEGVTADAVPYNIEDITDKNDWIAVIHADGNGLGQIVQRIGHDRQNFKRFSKELDEATITAAQRAFKEIALTYYWYKVIPIRPVVLGGDDLTVICRADLAMDFVKFFIQYFEEETSRMHCFSEKGQSLFTEGRVKDRLTACAGIAYVKSSYPFYYAYDLAEALCGEAKKNAKDKPAIREGKELPASCIMFHKLQDSFMDNYEELKRRELCPRSDLSFAFGPYYLREEAAEEHQKWTIGKLQDMANLIRLNNPVKTHLRNWMSLSFDNPELGKQKMTRLKNRLSMEADNEGWVRLVEEWTSPAKASATVCSPVYDMLALHTLNTQNTKRKEDEL